MNSLAYLDPGTGSLIIQFIVGGVFGAALVVKIFWRRLTGLFKKEEKDNDADPQKRSDV